MNQLNPLFNPKKSTLTKVKVWASLVAQLVKKPPPMQETQVQFLVQEELLEKG